jgi:two-component system OmpR family response regulator
VTARELYEDIERGFLAGTDDYMVKPVDLNEMLLRVGALLRRAKIANEHRLVCGASVLDYDSFTVTVGDTVTSLPQKEFLLLFKLLSYPGKIFTRAQLMDEIWGVDSETDERTVDVHINRLRDHFRANPDFSVLTVRGLGYKAVKADA